MTSDLIHDRGPGPELVGTRITVYDLLPYFLDSTATETYICRMYDLTPEQVAAARAYVFNHLDTVLAQHLKIEARMAVGNPPEVIERAKQTHATLLKFKQWLIERDKAAAEEDAAERASANGSTDLERFPTFREWFAQQEAQATEPR
jgi:uncharacterized protein (DUF433 family)